MFLFLKMMIIEKKLSNVKQIVLVIDQFWCYVKNLSSPVNNINLFQVFFNTLSTSFSVFLPVFLEVFFAILQTDLIFVQRLALFCMFIVGLRTIVVAVISYFVGWIIGISSSELPFSSYLVCQFSVRDSPLFGLFIFSVVVHLL